MVGGRSNQDGVGREEGHGGGGVGVGGKLARSGEKLLMVGEEGWGGGG